MKHIVNYIKWGLVVFFVIHIVEATWPVCGFLIGALILYSGIDEKDKIWKKAIEALLVPIILGLLLIFFAMIVVALVATPDTNDEVWRSEQIVVWLADFLKEHLEFGWRGYLLLLLGLLSLIWLSLLLPRWQLVSRFIRAKRYAELGATALAFAASFTFFGNKQIITPAAEAARARWQLQYALSVRKERINIASCLLLRSLSSSLENASQSDLRYLVDLATAIDEHPRLEPEAKEKLAEYLAQEQSSDYEKMAHNLYEQQDDMGYYDIPTANLENHPTSILTAQRHREALTEQSLKEAEAALTKATEETLGVSTGRVSDLLGHFFEGAIREQLPIEYQVAELFIKKLGDEYTSKLAEKMVEPFLPDANALLRKWAQRYAHKSPTLILKETIYALGVTRPRYLAAEAMKLTEMCEKSHNSNLAEDAKTKADEAETLVDLYNPTAYSADDPYAPIVPRMEDLASIDAVRTAEAATARDAAQTAARTAEAAAHSATIAEEGIAKSLARDFEHVHAE
ncbi:MAG: hypothetical protein ACRYFV_15635 [Janthinobacterium lividum]